jgi:molecular chaperone DnaJ
MAGATVELNVPALVFCPACLGSGAREGTSPVSCEDCGGYGQIRIQQGFFTVQQTCPSCRGKGRRIMDPCSSCRGNGRIRQQKKLSVRIPKGVDTGDRIRLQGEGEAGDTAGVPGDLYVEISVKPHAVFAREGSNLTCEVPVNFATVTLGGEIQVPSPTGQIKLNVPAETQSGKVFRLKGMGVPSVRGGGQGDLLCRVIVETPVNLTHKQKELLSQFDRTLSVDNRHNPRRASWFDRVKNFFEGMK